MAITRWRIFRFTFELICFIGVVVMVGFWFYKYEVEDRDIGVVDYELLEKTDVELPALSLCFENPLLMDNLNDIDPEVNSTTYLKYLKGEVYDDLLGHIDYFNVTLDLNKYFAAATIRLSNESFHRPEKITTLNHKTIFNGLYYGTFIKCFAAEIKKTDFPSKIKEINYYYNHAQLLNDLGPGHTMHLNLHYPGQFLLEIDSATPFDIGEKSQHTNISILDIEYLRRRNSRKKQCMTQWKSFDDMVWKKHIRRNRCRAPYDRPYDSFVKCTTKEDIQRSIFDFHVVGSKYYPKACQRISQLDFSTKTDRYKGYLSFRLSYHIDVKIITQSKEIDGHTLIGNIGGYIGLFLGNKGLFVTILILVV